MTLEEHYRTTIEVLVEFLKTTTTDALVANSLLQTIGLNQQQQLAQSAHKARVAPVISATLDQLQSALLQGEPEQIAKALHEWQKTANQLAMGLKNSYEA